MTKTPDSYQEYIIALSKLSFALGILTQQLQDSVKETETILAETIKLAQRYGK